MEEALKRNLFFALIAGFLSGVGIASLGFSPAFAVLSILLAVILSLYALCILPRDQRLPLFLLAGVFFCFALGMLRFSITLSKPDPTLSEAVSSEIALEGVIDREPRERESYREYIVLTDSGDRLLARAEMFPAFSIGDRILVRGILDLPVPFETDSGRVFDYARYLQKEGISYIVSFAKAEKVSDGGPSLRRVLVSFKYSFMRNVERVVPEPESSLLGGILLGIDDAMGKELLDAFRSVGLIHIVVLSGYNITLVAQAIASMLSFLPRRITLSGSAVAIVLFAIMVGAGPSVIRASMMALLVLFARAAHRTYDIARALLLAAAGMVLVNPLVLVFDLGFQLSFLATIALIWLAPLVTAKLTFIPEKFELREIASATIATQVFVLPLLAYSVGSVSLSGFLVNLIVLPLVPAVMLFGFIAGALGFLSGTLAFLPGVLAYALLSFIVFVAETVAGFSWSTVHVAAVSAAVPLILYALFFGALLFRRERALFLALFSRFSIARS